MLKRWLTFVFLFMVILGSACGGGEEPTEEPDVEATVEAAMAATEAAAPTDTAPPPTDTPVPPTETPEPEPSPTEARVLELDEAAVSFSPEETNFATDLTFRLEVEGDVVSELVVDGVTNADGNSSITYDVSNVDVAPAAATVTILEVDGTTYFSMPDGTCVSSAMGNVPLGDMVVNTGAIVLDTENLVTGQLQWNGTTDVNGITTDEYLIDVDNLMGTMGITNMTQGVLNVAQEGNYVVRLILEGDGSTEVLAPGVAGEMYYELNFMPSDRPFEIELPANCTGGGDTGDGDTGDGDTGDGDTGGGEATVEIRVSQSSTNVSHQCQGGNVIVDGASNNITLTGTCNELIVNGASNRIDVEAVSAINVSGAGNRITYGGSPAITNTGLGNVINPRQ